MPERPQAEPEDDGLEQLRSQVAREDHPDLRWERRTRSAVMADEACKLSMTRYLGTASVTARRYLGTASVTITPATVRTAVRISSGYPPDEDESLVEDVVVAPLPPWSRDERPDRLITRMSRNRVMNPQTLATTPMEMASSEPPRPGCRRPFQARDRWSPSSHIRSQMTG